MAPGLATLGTVRRLAARRLGEASPPVDTPALDARLLVAAALDLAPERLALEEDRILFPAEIAAIDSLIERRLAGEPVARILGHREFWGLDLVLSAGTLVPRPDSETLIEAVLAALSAPRREMPLRIADIGTGSGALLLALLSELPNATGIGVDLSDDALRTAKGNAERLGLGGRSGFVQGNWAEAIGAVDVLVSNPPYIRSDVITTLAVDVREFDPMLALDGGIDGLVAYRALIDDLDRVLAPEGLAFFEIGFDQRAEVCALAAAQGFESAVRRDLAGHDRVVAIRRPGQMAASRQFE